MWPEVRDRLHAPRRRRSNNELGSEVVRWFKQCVRPTNHIYRGVFGEGIIRGHEERIIRPAVGAQLIVRVLIFMIRDDLLVVQRLDDMEAWR